MDEKIRKIISNKLDEIFTKNDEITKIISSIDSLDAQSLRYGIIIGRLYNSFYYQHRRILERNPSSEEFNEFIDFIKNNAIRFQKIS